MGYSSGSMQLSGSGKVTGSIPAQGGAAANQMTAAISVTAATSLALRFGVGSGAANLFCSYTVALAAGASFTADLYTGTDIRDLHGNTAPFRIVRGVEVAIIDGGDTTGVRVGGAASDEWIGYFVAAGDKQDIYPDGAPWCGSSPAGKAVTASVKNFKVENRSAVETTIRILLAGSTFQSGEWVGLLGLLTYA